MRKFAYVLMIVLLVISLGGSALAKVKNPKVVEGWALGRYGGTLTGAFISDPKTFNYILASETSSTDVLGFVFDAMVESNGVTTEVEPALAERWTYSKDGKVWTFFLRQGVQWHDGKEFTADDVIFTLDVIYDEKVPNSTRDVLQVDGKPLNYRKIDKYTVEFTLPKPFAPMLRSMGFPIMPKHLLEDAWKKGKFNETWGVNTHPSKVVGTGPYKMVQYVPGQHIVYTRNTNYWKVDSKKRQLPYISRFIYRIVENQDAQALMFQKGDTDFYTVRGTEYDQFTAGAQKGNYIVHNAGPNFGTLFLVINQNKKFVPEPKLSWFTNLKFRQAIAHAVDKDALTKAAFGGHAVPQWSYESVAKGINSNSNVAKYPYNLTKSGALLAEAGFKKGSDGYLRDSKGNIVEFEINTNAGNKQRETLASLVAEDLRKLGMKVKFVPLDFNLLVSRLMSGEGWSCIVMGLTGGNPDPNSGANVWRSDGNLHMWNVGWDKPQTSWEARIDQIYDLGAVTMDPVARRKLYYEAQDIVADQVPMIFTVAQIQYTAVRNKWENIKPTAFGGTLHNIEVIFQK